MSFHAELLSSDGKPGRRHYQTLAVETVLRWRSRGIGSYDTELSRYFPGYFKFLAPIIRPLFNSAASGAWTTLRAATDPGVRGGDYFGPAKRFETAGPAVVARSSRASRDAGTAQELWDLSVQMTGVEPAI